MPSINPQIKGVGYYEVMEDVEVSGFLIACYTAEGGAFLGRRYFPDLADPADIPAALAGGAAEARPPAVVTAADLRARLRARLAERRWEVETGGFVFLDRPIASDDRSQTSILGVFTAAGTDPDFTTNWKCADATWLMLNNAQCAALFDAAASHKQGCFAREAVLAGQIEATADDRAALRALEPVVEAFW